MSFNSPLASFFRICIYRIIVVKGLIMKEATSTLKNVI